MAPHTGSLTPAVQAGIVKRVTQIGVWLLIQAVLLFATAGRLDWVGAWAYLAITVIGFLVVGARLLRVSPETAARRATPEGIKAWDKWVSGLLSLTHFVLPLAVAGLDVRFGWSPPLPGWLWWVAALLFSAGYGLFGWALTCNAYFATVVRVQPGVQRVCSTGPYRVVRHPGYVGMVVQALTLPLLLESYWALVPGVISVALLILRTALEDRTLRAELPGYTDYAARVRSRLLPGVW